MSKVIPQVQKYMSIAPHTIGAEQSLSRAEKVMRELGVRHLPVLQGGSLVGMLTDRDVKLVESLRGVDAERVRVEDAMTQGLYTVAPEAPLDSVADEMAAHKYGSAVVVQNGKVVGIFTTVDACSALRDLLHTRLAR